MVNKQAVGSNGHWWSHGTSRGGFFHRLGLLRPQLIITCQVSGRPVVWGWKFAYQIYTYIYIYMIPCILITTVYGWWFYSTFVFEFPFFGKDHHRPSCTLPSFIFSGKCSQQTIPVFSCVASGWLPTSFSSSSTAVEVPEQTKPLRPQKCEINTCRAGRNIAKKPMKATSTQKENNKNPRSATWYFLLFGFASTRKAMLIFQLVKSIRHQNIALVSTSAAKKTHQWLRMQFSIPALFRPSLLSSFTFRGKCPSIFYRANR